MSNYSNNFLEAIDMVVSQRLNDINFDKTIQCKIIDDRAKGNSQYTVEYEAMKMTVYTSDTTNEYKTGDEVYVLVPQGDFNLRKIIIGRVSQQDLPVYLYTNPLKHLIVIDNVNQGKDTITLLRSYSAEAGMPTARFLGFAADFQTSGKPDYTKKYGIKITGFGILKTDNKTEETIDWEFNSTQFQGNPYAFNGLFRQEQLFNIERFAALKDIQIELFNENSEFNAEMDNVQLVYGYATEDLVSQNLENKIILYEENELDTYPVEEQANYKLQLNTTFYRNYTHTNLANTTQYKLKWYIYDQQAKDTGNGAFWAKVVQKTNGSYTDYALSSLELGGKLYLQLDNQATYKLKQFPNIEDKALQVMVQVWGQDNGVETKLLTSNILAFRRQDQADLEGALRGSGIELTINNNGNYFIYDASSRLMIPDLRPAQTDMRAIAKLTGAAKWATGSTIIWKFPLQGTMIQKPTIDIMDMSTHTYVTAWNPSYLQGNEQFINSLERKVVTDGNKVYYKVLPEDYTETPGVGPQICLARGITETDADNHYQDYWILEQYDTSLTNNIIQCNVIYPAEDDIEMAYAGKLLNFGIKGSQGTEYTVIITLDRKVMEYSENAEIIATAHFYDPAGQEIEGEKFYWDWSDSQKLNEYFELTTTEGRQDSYSPVVPVVDEDDILSTDEQYYIWDEDNQGYKKVSGAYNPEVTYYKQNAEVLVGKSCTIKLTDKNIDFKEASPVITATLYNWQLKNRQRINFKAMCPIPLWTGSAETAPQVYGATSVIYNFQGSNPEYIDTPYMIESNKDSLTNIELLTKDTNIVISKDNKLIVPELAPTKFVPVTVKLTTTLGQWYQPILFMRNEYISTLLNSWNSNEQFNDGTTILTKIVGAGQKNDAGQFSGVFMGAVGSELEETAATGLYGFQNGQLRYKFTENGDAYIGTGSDNRINFEGGNLDIAAKHFSLNTNKIYLSDESRPDDEKELLVNLADAFTVNSEGTVTIGGGNKTNFIHKVEYGTNNSLTQMPSTWNDNTPTDWEKTSLYLWARTQISAGNYTFSQTISSYAEEKYQYSVDKQDNNWHDESNKTNQDKYYRRIRYIENTDAIDILEGPLEVVFGSSPYVLDLSDDYDTFVIGSKTKEWIDNTATIKAILYEGNTQLTTDVVTYSCSYNNELKEKISVEKDNDDTFVLTATDTTLSSGSITITGKYKEYTRSKIFNFKVITVEKDYDLKSDKTVVNIDSDYKTVNLTVVDSDGTIYENPQANHDLRIMQGESTQALTSWTVTITEDTSFTLEYNMPQEEEDNWVKFDEINIETVQNGASGNPGETIFTSVVFTRVEDTTTPATPTGGTFNSPIPTDTNSEGKAIWSDGIPTGNGALWSSRASFESTEHQIDSPTWSAPTKMADTANFEVKYSSVQTNPGTPTTDGTNWSDQVTVDAVWMATRHATNNVWSKWVVTKIKGESPYSIFFDNDYDMVVRLPDGKLSSKDITVNLQYFLGNTEVESINNVTITAESCTAKLSEYNKKLIVTPTASNENNGGTVTVKWQGVTKKFKFDIMDGTEDYDLIITPTTINTSALSSNTTQKITIRVKDSKGRSYGFDEGDTKLPDNVKVKWGNDEYLEKNPTVNNTFQGINVSLLYTTTTGSNVLFDKQYIGFVKDGKDGQNGSSPITVKLSDEYDAFTINPKTNEWVDYETTIYASLYNGSTIIDQKKVEWSLDDVEITPKDTVTVTKAEHAGYKIKANDAAKDEKHGSVTVKGTYGGTKYSKKFNYSIVHSETDYELRATKKVINISSTTATDKQTTLTVVDSKNNIYTKPTNKLKIYKSDGTTEVTSWENIAISANSTYILKYNGIKFDEINIEVVQDGTNGQNGENGVSITSVVTRYYLSTSATTIPANNDTAWVETFNDIFTKYRKAKKDKPNTTYYIWTQEKFTYSNNTTKYSTATVSSADSKVVAWCDANDETVIDGSYIATGTIAAQSISTFGKWLYPDAKFDKGFNGINVYNNGGGSQTGTENKLERGNVSIERIANPGKDVAGHYDNDNSKYILKIQYNGEGSVSPGLGGFSFGTQSRANAIFVYRLIANIPTGYSLAFETNKLGGTSSQHYWLTSNMGTGKYQEYTYRVICGTEAPFSTTGFFYLTGSDASTPVIWYLGEATCSDMAAGTTIDGACITTGSIAADKIQTGILYSHNYAEDSEGNVTGTYFNLDNGSIKSKNFNIDSEGNALFKGRLELGVGLGATENKIELNNSEYGFGFTNEKLNTNYEFLSLNLDGANGIIKLTTWDTENLCELRMQWGTGELSGSWKSASCLASVSDANKKNTISPISAQYSSLFDNLQPVTYKYNDGTSDRLHTGFIAQDVQDALDAAGIDSTDFAGLVIFERGTDRESWALRYEEFIALNTQQIQKAKARITELEEKVAALEQKLTQLT